MRVSSNAPALSQADRLPAVYHNHSSLEERGRRPNRRGLLAMGTALAGAIAATVSLPRLSIATPVAATPAPSHPDAAIFALCKEWQAMNEEYERVCREESPIQEALLAKSPKRPIFNDPIPMGRGRAAKVPLNNEEGRSSSELRSIADGKVLYIVNNKNRNRVTTTMGTHGVPRTSIELAKTMLAQVEKYEKQHRVIWAKVTRSENKHARALCAADRISDRIGAMPAKTLEGIKAKIHVFLASLMLETAALDDPFTPQILGDIERLGIQGMA